MHEIGPQARAPHTSPFASEPDTSKREAQQAEPGQLALQKRRMKSYSYAQDEVGELPLP